MSYNLPKYASGMSRSTATVPRHSETPSNAFVNFASLLESLALQPVASPVCDELLIPSRKSKTGPFPAEMLPGPTSAEAGTSDLAMDTASITTRRRKQPKSVGTPLARPRSGSVNDSNTLTYEQALRSHARYHSSTEQEVVLAAPTQPVGGVRKLVKQISQVSNTPSGVPSAASERPASQVASIPPVFSPASRKNKQQMIANTDQQQSSPAIKSQNSPLIEHESLALPAAIKASSMASVPPSLPLPRELEELLSEDQVSVSSMHELHRRKQKPFPRSYRIADLRCSTISVRLSDIEAERLRKRAEESEMSISAYLRSCVLEADQLRAQVKQALAELRALSHTASGTSVDSSDRSLLHPHAGTGRKADSPMAQWLEGCRSLWGARRRNRR